MAKEEIGNTSVVITINCKNGTRNQEFKFNLKEDEKIGKVVVQQIVTQRKSLFDSSLSLVSQVDNANLIPGLPGAGSGRLC